MDLLGTATALLSLSCAAGLPPSGFAPISTSAVVDRPVLTPQTSGTDVLLQAVSVVSASTVWVAGHRATYARTTNGGRTWRAGTVPGPDSLQLRDVHGVDSLTAYVLAAGPGEMSRIYRTDDGGGTWTLQFQNRRPDAFFDCFDFWDPNTGVAFSDAVDGRVIVIRTEDGGATWRAVDRRFLPAAAGSEGAFAASGTCVVVAGVHTGWIGTGAGHAARVYRTADRGRTWTVVPTPIVGGTGSTGIASLSVLPSGQGVALGGDISDPDGYTDNVAVSTDGGHTWTLAGRPSFSGAVYGSAPIPGVPDALVAVGPRGMSYSRDAGSSWIAADRGTYWAVGFAGPEDGWAVGPGGKIVHIRFTSAGR